MKAKIDLTNKNPKPVKHISSLNKGDIVEYKNELYVCGNLKTRNDEDCIEAICIGNGVLATFAKEHLKNTFLCEINVTFVRYVGE
jgi:hypothetical protein